MICSYYNAAAVVLSARLDALIVTLQYQGLKELAEWVNPEYLSPSMADQCAAAFNENGSTIQLHRFLKVRNRPFA